MRDASPDEPRDSVSLMIDLTRVRSDRSSVSLRHPYEPSGTVHARTQARCKIQRTTGFGIARDPSIFACRRTTKGPTSCRCSSVGDSLNSRRAAGSTTRRRSRQMRNARRAPPARREKTAGSGPRKTVTEGRGRRGAKVLVSLWSYETCRSLCTAL